MGLRNDIVYLQFRDAPANTVLGWNNLGKPFHMGVFSPATALIDGAVGIVPKPLAGQQNHVLSGSGWVVNTAGVASVANGLRLDTGAVAKWGGPLMEDTFIDATNHSINLGGWGGAEAIQEFYINTLGGTWIDAEVPTVSDTGGSMRAKLASNTNVSTEVRATVAKAQVINIVATAQRNAIVTALSLGGYSEGSGNLAGRGVRLEFIMQVSGTSTLGVGAGISYVWDDPAVATLLGHYDFTLHPANTTAVRIAQLDRYGFKYEIDNSVNWTDRHLIDKAYADSSPGAGGIGQTAVGIWKFDNVITTTPPTAQGFFRFNNATQNLATAIYLNEKTTDNKDTANFIAALAIGDSFYIQEKAVGTRWIRAVVSGTLTDNGTWWTIPITVTNSSGVNIANNQDTVIRVMFGAISVSNSAAVNEVLKSASSTSIVGTGVFSSTLGNIDLGSASLSGGSGRIIQVVSSDPDVSLAIQAKGTGGISFKGSSLILTPPTGNNIMRFDSTAGSIGISFSKSTGTADFTINGTNGSVGSINGDKLVLVAGAGYSVSGNGNGGNIEIRSGNKRAAGSGIDGDVIINAYTGNIILTQTLPTGAVADVVLVRNSATGAIKSVVQSGVNEAIQAVVVSAGTLTLDINNQKYRTFDLTTTQSSNFTIAVSNATNLIYSRLTLRITGTIAVTLPSEVIMSRAEEVSGRWNSSTNILTVTGVTASPFLISFEKDGAGNLWAFCSERGV